MEDNETSWILFEPAQLLNQDPNPNKHTYKLGDNVLEHWAKEGTQIRTRFREKADFYGRIKDDE